MLINSNIGLVPGLILFVFLAVFGSLILSVTWTHRSDLRSQMRLFIAAFIVRFLFSIAIYQFGLISILKDEDSSGWILGIPLLERWRGIDFTQLPVVLLGAYQGHHQGYRYLMGALFFITNEPHRMTAAVLNCFFGALTVVFTYRLARTLASSWVATRVGWWCCFAPSLIVWSAQTVKEPIVILLEAIGLYACVQLKSRGASVRHVVMCALAILLVVPFRFYAAWVIGAAILLSLLLPHLALKRMNVGSAILVALMVIPLLLWSGILVSHEATFNSFDAKAFDSYRRGLAGGQGSGYEMHYDIQTPSGFGMTALIGGAHLLMAPFPWELLGGSTRKILVAPELVVWWWVFIVGVVPGAWFCCRHRFSDTLPLFFFCFMLGLLYSVTFGNVGLIFRQRAQLLPWLLVFALIGLEQRALRKQARRAWMLARRSQAVRARNNALSPVLNGAPSQPLSAAPVRPR